MEFSSGTNTLLPVLFQAEYKCCAPIKKKSTSCLSCISVYTVQSSSSFSKWGGGAGRFVDFSGVGGSGKSKSSSLQNLVKIFQLSLHSYAKRALSMFTVKYLP